MADIETRNHLPCFASCGAPFIFVELKEPRALAAAQPRADVFAERLPRDRVTGIHLYVQAERDGIDIRSRMFAPLHGIPEDPATGSANVALIGLMELQPDQDLRLSKKIAQVEMGRPSLLEASAEKRDGTIVATMIGGACVPVMQGVINLD